MCRATCLQGRATLLDDNWFFVGFEKQAGKEEKRKVLQKVIVFFNSIQLASRV